MDSSGYGKLIADTVIAMIVITALVTGVIVGSVTWYLTKTNAPTVESIDKQKQRQAVIRSLTDEQREVLGL